MLSWIKGKKRKSRPSISNRSQLVLDGMTIDVIRRRKKHVSLSVLSPSGDIRVIAPLRIHDEVLVQIVRGRFPWISRQRNRVEYRRERSERKFGLRAEDLGSGLVARRFSKRLTVILGRSEQSVPVKRRQRVCWDGRNTLHLTASNPIEYDQLLWSWYREQLHAAAVPLIEKWESMLGVATSRLVLRRMKTRWGSCHTGNGSICLNLELIRRPQRCLEFVIVHELVHLLERGHTVRFYQLMDKYLPRWRVCKAVLDGMPIVLDPRTTGAEKWV